MNQYPWYSTALHQLPAVAPCFSEPCITSQQCPCKHQRACCLTAAAVACPSVSPSVSLCIYTLLHRRHARTCMYLCSLSTSVPSLAYLIQHRSATLYGVPKGHIYCSSHALTFTSVAPQHLSRSGRSCSMQAAELFHHRHTHLPHILTNPAPKHTATHLVAEGRPSGSYIYPPVAQQNELLG
jgi:hypothetical protein